MKASITGICIMHYNGTDANANGQSRGMGGMEVTEVKQTERRTTREMKENLCMGKSIRESKRLNFFQPINQMNKHSNFFQFEGFL